jgi:hypothetical protein
MPGHCPPRDWCQATVMVTAAWCFTRGRLDGNRTTAEMDPRRRGSLAGAAKRAVTQWAGHQLTARGSPGDIGTASCSHRQETAWTAHPILAGTA